MAEQAVRSGCIRFPVICVALLLCSGLAGCDQAPTPPAFRPYEEPEPFEPPEMDYTLDEASESSVE
jgi:hypothetical protein